MKKVLILTTTVLVILVLFCFSKPQIDFDKEYSEYVVHTSQHDEIHKLSEKNCNEIKNAINRSRMVRCDMCKCGPDKYIRVNEKSVMSIHQHSDDKFILFFNDAAYRIDKTSVINIESILNNL